MIGKLTQAARQLQRNHWDAVTSAYIQIVFLCLLKCLVDAEFFLQMLRTLYLSGILWVVRIDEVV